MSGEIRATITGNLTADPDRRDLGQGKSVTSFTVASTPGKFNSNTKEWDDGETLFVRVSVWGDKGDAVVENFSKGNEVVVYGNITQRTYINRQQVEVKSLEVSAIKVARVFSSSTKSGSTVTAQNADLYSDTPF